MRGITILFNLGGQKYGDRIVPWWFNHLLFPIPRTEVLWEPAKASSLIERPTSGSEWRVKHRALTDKHISSIIKEPESGLTFAGAFSGLSARQRRRREDLGAERQRTNGTNVYSLASRRVNGRVRLFAGPSRRICSPATIWVLLERSLVASFCAQRAEMELPCPASYWTREAY